VCGINVEGIEANITDNVFEDIYNGKTSGSYAVAYDVYASVRNLIFEKNITKNVLSPVRCTLFKSKGSTLSSYATRIIKNNRYTWDNDWLNERGYGVFNEGGANESVVPAPITWLEMDVTHSTGEISYNTISGGKCINLSGTNSCKFKDLHIHDNVISFWSTDADYPGLIRCTRGTSGDSSNVTNQHSVWNIHNNKFTMNDPLRTDCYFLYFREKNNIPVKELIIKDNTFNFKEVINTIGSDSVGKAIIGPNYHIFDHSIDGYTKSYLSEGFGLKSNNVTVDTIVTAGTSNYPEIYLYKDLKGEYSVNVFPISDTSTTIEVFRQYGTYDASYVIEYEGHKYYASSTSLSTYKIWDSSENSDVLLDTNHNGLVFSTISYASSGVEKKELNVSVTTSTVKKITLKTFDNDFDNNIGKTIQTKETVTPILQMTIKRSETSPKDGSLIGIQSTDILGTNLADNSRRTFYVANTFTKDAFYKFHRTYYSTWINFTNYVRGSNPVTPSTEKVINAVTSAGQNVPKSEFDYKVFSIPDPTEYPYIEIGTSNNSYVDCGICDSKITFVEEDGAKAGVTRIGNSTSKPSSTDIYNGFQYYDTTLKKYICWNGSTWVNLDGTALT
jgi:hypothetical protein